MQGALVSAGDPYDPVVASYGNPVVASCARGSVALPSYCCWACETEAYQAFGALICWWSSDASSWERLSWQDWAVLLGAVVMYDAVVVVLAVSAVCYLFSWFAVERLHYYLRHPKHKIHRNIHKCFHILNSKFKFKCFHKSCAYMYIQLGGSALVFMVFIQDILDIS